jgi:hypothetical protein
LKKATEVIEPTTDSAEITERPALSWRYPVRQHEMFKTAVRTSGDFAGVFEYSDGVGYFYLYNVEADPDHKIVTSVYITNEVPDFTEEDVCIRWDVTERIVGLFIRDHLWAAVDVDTQEAFGGNYQAGVRPGLSAGIEARWNMG